MSKGSGTTLADTMKKIMDETVAKAEERYKAVESSVKALKGTLARAKQSGNITLIRKCEAAIYNGEQLLKTLRR